MAILYYLELFDLLQWSNRPLRKRTLKKEFQFIFSTLGHPIKMAWSLKTVPAPTLIAHIKKSDIRGNLGYNQFQKTKWNIKLQEALVYASLPLSQLPTHIPVFIPFATYLNLLVSYSACKSLLLSCGLACRLSLFLIMRPRFFIFSFSVHILYFPLGVPPNTSHLNPHLINVLHIPRCPGKVTRLRDWRQVPVPALRPTSCAIFFLSFLSVQQRRIQTDNQEPNTWLLWYVKFSDFIFPNGKGFKKNIYLTTVSLCS